MTKHILVALPALALGLSACSADDPDPKPQTDKLKSGDISLTIPLASTRTGDDTSSLMDKMSIVAYDAGGHLIETIYKNGSFVKNKSGVNEGFDDIYEVNGYGTVMSLTLSNDIYGGFLDGTGYIPDHDDYNEDDNAHKHKGIQLVAFYLPDESAKFGDDTTDFEPPYDLKDLSSEIKADFILHHPAAENGIWENADEMKIPMAGTLNITDAVKNYDPALWNENNPMFLNHDPLMLIRTMAKVTIKSQENFVTEASFKTAKHGTLLPNSIGSDGVVSQVTIPEQTDFKTNFDLLQNYSGQDEAHSSFVFYTFERDLTGDNNKGLIKVNSTLGENTFDFKPTDPADEQKNEWKGILRNHSYTFTILKPENSEMTVNVVVKEWEPDHYNVDL